MSDSGLDRSKFLKSLTVSPLRSEADSTDREEVAEGLGHLLVVDVHEAVVHPHRAVLAPTERLARG